MDNRSAKNMFTSVNSPTRMRYKSEHQNVIQREQSRGLIRNESVVMLPFVRSRDRSRLIDGMKSVKSIIITFTSAIKRSLGSIIKFLDFFDK